MTANPVINSGHPKTRFIPLFTFAVILVGAAKLEAATGFSWLKLGSSARMTGLGQAAAATSQGAESLFANPAGLGAIHQHEVMVTHTPWIEQITVDTMGVILPTTFGQVGMGGLWLNVPGLERRGPGRELLGDFTTRHWVGLFGWSTPLTSAFAVGFNLKLIGESLDDVTGMGMAVDLGMHWTNLLEGLSVGIALNHLGTGIKLLSEVTALPTTLTIGGSYELPGGLRCMADLIVERDVEIPALRLGTEFFLVGLLALRVGYLLDPASGLENVRLGSLALPTGMVGGFGIRVASLTFDYALAPVNGFGFTHRFGMKNSW